MLLESKSPGARVKSKMIKKTPRHMFTLVTTSKHARVIGLLSSRQSINNEWWDKLSGIQIKLQRRGLFLVLR